jgi:signal transduction histidine kinase
LTAEIVHEIKNPLSFIGNFSEGSIELIEDLLKYLSDNFQEKEGMQFVHFEEQLLELKLNAIDICTNTQRANEIVYKIMDQTNLQNQFQIVNVNDIIVENWNFSWSNFKHQYPQLDIEININLLPDLQPILANKNSLGRVLLNIFDNAFDALIQKKSECLDLFTPKILITCFLKEDKMHMLIEDNGLGIPITKLDEIFQPFYTTKPIGEGNAGLGLSISKEIIENEHLGKLLVESELGQYARFIIILPI